MKKRSPALETALAFLRAHIEQKRNKAQYRMETVQMLASQANVSYVTMWKAIDNLKKEGVIEATQCRGITINPERNNQTFELADLEPEQKKNKQKWEILCDIIEADILKGAYVPGDTLKAGKLLMERYDVCYETLKKALMMLVEQDILKARGTHFEIPDLSKVKNKQCVILFANGDKFRNLRLCTNRSSDFIRYLEGQCAQKGIQLEICLYRWNNDNIVIPEGTQQRIKRLQSQFHVLGFLVWTIGINDEHNIEKVTSFLFKQNLPIAFFVENSTVSLPVLSGRKYKIFVSGFTASCGEDVARYLLRMGHRTIAYVSPFGQSSWSQNRLQGLISIYKQAGLPQGVLPFTEQFSGRQVQKLALTAKLQTTIESLLEQSDHDLQIIGEAMENNAELLQRWSRMGYTSRTMVPIMEKAIANKKITAWVVANDYLGFTALQFLRKRGIGVPRDLSVVSFDDMTESFSSGLSSYNFNVESIVDAMITYLVESNTARGAHIQEGTIEIKGYLKHRQSLGAPAEA